jgi:hypothetical protein
MGKSLGKIMTVCLHFRMSLGQLEKRFISVLWQPTFETRSGKPSQHLQFHSNHKRCEEVTNCTVHVFHIVSMQCSYEWMVSKSPWEELSECWTTGNRWMKEPRYQRTSYVWGWNWNGTVQWVTAERADLCNGNAVGVKSGGARFRSRSRKLKCPE